MLRNRLFVALSLVGMLLAGSLHADKITYVSGSGAKAEVKNEENISITDWSASKVTFKTKDDKSTSVDYKDVISLDRHYGTMGGDLSNALELVGSDPQGAIDALAQVAQSGSKLDKEEATIIRAQLLDNESANNASVAPEAIKAYSTYLSSWKAGYFAREAYRGLAALQENNKQSNAARTTLRNMAKADSSLQREGNQLLGELEAREGKWSDAISAFKGAQSAAKSEKDANSEALAKAWEGWMTLKAGNTASARTLLESVTTDSGLDDPDTVTDELALSIAFPALGDALFAEAQADERTENESYENAYNAYIKGAYYAWWVQGNQEGRCMGRAYVCAKKLEKKVAKAEAQAKWKLRKEKLQTALALGFPRILMDADKE